MTTKKRKNFMPHFQSHSETSRLAALALYETSGEKSAAVLELLRSRYPAGCTDDEGRAALGMHPNTYRPRRCETPAWSRRRLPGACRKPSGR
jgi:hypothetical protein